MTAILTIHDKDIEKHAPNILEKILYEYGFINCYLGAYSNLKDPLARKNKLTGIVSIRRYNETFSYWGWSQVEDRWSKHFKNKSQ